jgi:hypothetical protein
MMNVFESINGHPMDNIEEVRIALPPCLDLNERIPRKFSSETMVFGAVGFLPGSCGPWTFCGPSR